LSPNFLHPHFVNTKEWTEVSYMNFPEKLYTVKMNMLYLIQKIVATDYKQYY